MTTPRRIAETLTIVTLAATLAAPGTARAADRGTVQVIDQPADRRLVVSLGTGHDGEMVFEGALGEPIAVRVPRTSLVHRFRGALVDAEGRPLAGPVAWSVTLSGARETMARLSSARTALEIPRPYGVRVAEGESLQVVAELPGWVPEGAALRIVMEYEPDAVQGNRLPVAASAVTAPADRADGGVSFSWTAERDGRLVAMAGALLDAATAVVIEDAVTGAIVWRTRAPHAFAGVAPQRDGIVRPGVRLEAGRTYRVRIEGGVEAASPVVAPLMMMVPAR